jgi:hypothetical protein
MRRAAVGGAGRLPRALALTCAALLCCHRGGAGARRPLEPPADALRETTSDGPVEATVEVWPAKALLGDPIHLRLTVKARRGVDVDMPPWGEALGRFLIVGRFAPTARRGAEGGGTTTVQEYELQAQTSGRQRIPALRVTWTDGAARNAPRGHQAPAARDLWTGEVPLAIGTDLPPGELALRPALGPLSPGVSGPARWALLGVGALVAAAGGGVVLLRARRRRTAVRARASAYDAAMGRLQALEQAGAPDGALADTWYVELSAVVRRYLEDRYGIRAPELTTEEFLQEARRLRELAPAHRELLSAFLARCDRVKFASHRPDAAESRAALDEARAFVEETTPHPSLPPERGGSGRGAGGGAA